MGKRFTVLPRVSAQTMPNISRCVYCNILIHDALALPHMKCCPNKIISSDLNLDQKKIEIALYIFKLVPEFEEIEKEKLYFHNRGIDFMSEDPINELLFKYAADMYTVIRNIKKYKRFKMTVEMVIDFPPPVLDYFCAAFYMIGQEHVTVISDFYLYTHDFFRDPDWYDSCPSFIDEFRTTSAEDGGYVNLIFLN